MARRDPPAPAAKAPPAKGEPAQAASSGKRTKLKTSEELIAFIRTDPRFDPRLCTIAYADKLEECLKRCTVADWVPISQGGDIPYHRIYLLEIKSQVFWDREARLYDQDLLLRVAGGDGLPPFPNLLQPAADLPPALPPRFSVVSLNVLFDRYEHRITKLEPRLPRIVQALQELQADVVLLQECTPKVLAFLQQQEWLMLSYALVHTELDPYGQITLAKCRIAAEGDQGASEEVLTGHKKVLRVTLLLSAPLGEEATPGQPPEPGPGSVDVWNVHFPCPLAGSDTEPFLGRAPPSKGGQRAGMSRLQQLERVEQLARDRCAEGSACAALVGGDFNARGVGRQEMGPFGRRWRDAWVGFSASNEAPGTGDRGSPHRHTGLGGDEGQASSSNPAGRTFSSAQGPNGWDAGYTYDPRSNHLAQMLSRSQQPARLDRLMLFGSALKVHHMSLVGTTTFPPLSDHWGLRCTLTTVPLGDAEDHTAPHQDQQAAAAGADAGTTGTAAGVAGPDYSAGTTPLTVKTALTWIPHPGDWPALQAIRTSHDPKVGRIMPHIHIMYPFLEPTAFAQFTSKAAATPHTPHLHTGSTGSTRPGPRRASASVETLVHGGSVTVAIQPNQEKSRQLGELHRWACTLSSIAPPPRPFKPHLSLARIRLRAIPEPSTSITGSVGPSSSQGSTSHQTPLSSIAPVPEVSANDFQSVFPVGDNSSAAHQYRSVFRAASALLQAAEGWEVKRLCIVSRDGEDAAGFVVKRILDLPGTPPLSPQEALHALRQGLTHISFSAVGSHLLLPTEATAGTHKAGPHTTGTTTAGPAVAGPVPCAGPCATAAALRPTPSPGAGQCAGDLDVLAACNLPKEEALASIRAWMQTCGMFYNVYQVANEHMTFLRGWAAGGLELDIHVVQWPPPPQLGLRCRAPTPWDVGDAAELAVIMAAIPQEQAVALSMVSEPRWLCGMFEGAGQAPRYRSCLAAVRGWARDAGIYGQSYGYPGGMVWAILTAVALHRVIQAEQRTSQAVVARPTLHSAAAEGPTLHNAAAEGLEEAAAEVAMAGGLAGEGMTRERTPGAGVAARDVGSCASDLAAVLGELARPGFWGRVISTTAGVRNQGIQAPAESKGEPLCQTVMTAGTTSASASASVTAAAAATAAAAVVTVVAADGGSVGPPAAEAEAAVCEASVADEISVNSVNSVTRRSIKDWWRPVDRGGLMPRKQDLSEVRLATLPGSNAAHRLLCSTSALVRLALQAGHHPGLAAGAVASAKSALPHRLELYLSAEDEDDARLAVCWLLRHLHRLLVFMERECLAIAPDNAWRQHAVHAHGEGQPQCPAACATNPEEGAPTLVWSVHYLRDCTRLQVVVHELEDRFHRECKGMALWHEFHKSAEAH